MNKSTCQITETSARIAPRTNANDSGVWRHTQPPDGGVFLSRSAGAGMLDPVLAPDTLLGRFRILSHLNRGSVGHVYHAYDRVTDQDVALKVVRITAETDPGMESCVQREWVMYGGVDDHRHVLKIHNVHRASLDDADYLALSMEYADGGSLRSWLVQNAGNWALRKHQGIAYFKQACRGVAALHKVGILHLDLKPENLLIVHGVLKVADLGLARWRGSPRATSGLSPRGASAADVVGTPAYMSPECFFATYEDQVDARTDIYSLGIIFYEIRHPECRPPFAMDDSRLRDRHVYAPIPPLPQAGKIARRIVQSCLAKDRANRYASVQDLLNGLEAQGTGRGSSELWRRVCRQVERRRLDRAERLCRRLLHLAPRHAGAKNLLKELKRRRCEAGEIYTVIERDMERSSLTELSQLLLRAVELYPGYPAGQTIQLRLSHKARRYGQVMHAGLTAARRGEWQQAMAWMEKAKLLNPGAMEVQASAQWLTGTVEHVDQIRQRIDQAVARSDRDAALSLARELDQWVQHRMNSVPAPERQEPPAPAQMDSQTTQNPSISEDAP